MQSIKHISNNLYSQTNYIKIKTMENFHFKPLESKKKQIYPPALNN